MAEQRPSDERSSRKQDLGETIAQQAERKRRARERRRRAAWFGLGMFGLVGWSVAVPTLLGVAFGVWLDRHWPGEVSWTLTFLIIGAGLGCFNAWYWVSQESKRD
jgi:ATP synthase protein I